MNTKITYQSNQHNDCEQHYIQTWPHLGEMKHRRFSLATNKVNTFFETDLDQEEAFGG